MYCPHCPRDLEYTSIDSDFIVAICHSGCGGVWLDTFHRKYLDEAHPKEGDIFHTITPKHDYPITGEKKYCPKCKDVVMLRHYDSLKKAAVIDECPMCGGIWLHYNEIHTVRDQYQSAQQRSEHNESHALHVLSELT